MRVCRKGHLPPTPRIKELSALTPALGVALFLFSCSAGISSEAQSPSREAPAVPDIKLDLSLLSIGQVSSAEEGFAHPLQDLPVEGGGWSTFPSGEVEGVLHLSRDDARFQALAARTPLLAEKGVYTAYLPDGSRLTGEAQGAVVFPGGCAALSVAPLIKLSAPLPEEGTPLLLYAGLAERGPSVARMQEPTRELPEGLRDFFSSRLRGALSAMPHGAEAFYVVPLALDGDATPEYFVARAVFEPLGEEGARKVVLESFWLDPSDREVRVLSHEPPYALPQEDIYSFSRAGGWEIFLSPPVLLTDLNGDNLAEIVRQSVEGYELWLFDGKRLVPGGVGYHLVCD